MFCISGYIENFDQIKELLEQASGKPVQTSSKDKNDPYGCWNTFFIEEDMEQVRKIAG